MPPLHEQKAKALVTHTPLPTPKDPRNATVAHAKGKSRALFTTVDAIGVLPHARAIRPTSPRGSPLLMNFVREGGKHTHTHIHTHTRTQAAFLYDEILMHHQKQRNMITIHVLTHAHTY